MSDATEKIAEAQQELLEALRASKLVVWAKRDQSGGGPNALAVHDEVSASIFMDEIVTVTEWGAICADPDHPTAIYSYRGPRFREARFTTKDVLGIWPLRPAIEMHPTLPQTPIPTNERQSRGGVAPKHDWDGFWIEVAHYAAKNDLNPEHRRDLQRHMQAWTAEHWLEPPDPATIRSRMKRLFDPRPAARR